MLVSGGDDTDSTQVVSSGDHAQVTGIEFDVVGNGATFDVKNDRIVDVDIRIWVSDGSGIVGHQEWNTLLSHTDFGDSAQFVSSLFWGDSVNSKSAFDVIDKSEVFVGLFDGDDVHESSWVVDVSSDLTVDSNQSLHKNLFNFVPSKSVVKSVTEEDDKGETLPLFVWTLGWLRGVHSGKFVQHPVRWSIQTLQMLLGAARHDGLFWSDFC